MAEPAIDYSVDPVAFIDKFLPNNEQGKPWRLSAHQRAVLGLALTFEHGDLGLRLLLWSEVKKSGKTMVAACLAIWWGMTRGPTEVVCLANDLDQSVGRVFATVVALLQRNGFTKAKLVRLLAAEVRWGNGSVIRAVASDYKGEAGARHSLAIFDEIWAYDSERAHRLFEELQPIPTAREAWVLCVTTAGWVGESTLLEGLYHRGLAGERLDPELAVYRAGAYVMFWSHTPRQPWLTDRYYAEQAAVLRPSTYQRLHENRWVSQEGAFLTAEMWDANVDEAARPLLTCDTPVYVGVDGGLKSDNLAVMAVTWDGTGLRLVDGRIWRPTPGEALDLERTVEAYVLALHARVDLAVVRYDPWQLHRSMAALKAAGVPVEEYTQTEEHVGAMGSTLYDLLKGKNLVLYPDAELRQQALHAVAVEKARGGFAIRKERASRKIDGVVALAIACVAALEAGPVPTCAVCGEAGCGGYHMMPYRGPWFGALAWKNDETEPPDTTDHETQPHGVESDGRPVLSALSHVTGFAARVQAAAAATATRVGQRLTAEVTDATAIAAEVGAAVHRGVVTFKATGADPDAETLAAYQRLRDEERRRASTAHIERQCRRHGGAWFPQDG